VSPLLVEAPSDAQLLTIRHMLAERGLEPPDVIARKREASEIIGAIQAGTYNPELYAYPLKSGELGVPF
jgi:hypothetical protein